MADEPLPKVAEFCALPDERSCALAKRLDGTQWAFYSEEHLAHEPPLANCEFGEGACTCTLLYYDGDE